MSNIKILCYGAGDCFKLYHKNINFDLVEVLAVLDQNPPFDGKFNYPIAAPYPIPIVHYEKCNDYAFDYIVIFSYNNAVQIYENLLKYNVPDEKILYAEMNSVLDKNYEMLNSLLVRPADAYAVMDMPFKYNKTHMSDFKRTCRTDYVRISTLDLIANQIIEAKVGGAVAEAGVFRGFFSSLINGLFPDRELYLFDTFEGFDDRDMCDGSNHTGLVTDKLAFGYKEFQDTSVELVLSSMPNRSKCIVKKGYFPDTTVDIADDVKFAFVSLDMDLYAPMYAGLIWFYNRMTKGAYIMVHDYNNYSCVGVKQAVDQFMKEYGVGFVPIPDYCGSVIIVKQ